MSQTTSEIPKDHRMEDLVLYEENLLDPDERRELEEHLRGCAECQATLLKVKHTLPLLHEALKPRELPAEELLRRAKAQVQANKEKRAAKVLVFRRARVAVMGFAVAAAAAAGLLVLVQTRQVGPGTVVQAGEDAGARSGYVAAPRPQNVDAGVDGGAEKVGGEVR